MIIKSIDLTNFRSHDHYHLDCKDQTSVSSALKGEHFNSPFPPTGGIHTTLTLILT